MNGEVDHSPTITLAQNDAVLIAQRLRENGRLGMALPAFDEDPGYTDFERASWETAHRFARDVMRPAGVALDKLNAADVIAAKSILWDVFAKHRELGLDALDADSDMPPQERARLRCIVGEEMGWGDSGLAIALGVAAFPAMMAQMSGNPALCERFPQGTLGCWAITEPDHGSDFIDFNGVLRQAGGHSNKPNCVARRDGNHFVITGQKSAWVSNGTIAQAAALFCAVDMGDGRPGNAVFVVPLNEGGVTRGKPTDKIGQRPLNQGEIFFEDLRVSADCMVAPPEAYRAVTDQVLSLANASMGTTFVGCARAALDLALDYAKTRIQGDVPIFAHQSVKARLFRMFRSVEAARALNQRVTRINATRVTPLLELAIASKVTSTQAAFDVASDALQLFGGAGISRDCPIEKIFRDARISMIEDGCNEVLGMAAAARF
ncbi:MAG: acyl-CoA dehydrogenase family protein [Caulobacterales bacterium]|nr:acyl-CoA dehydrogenase family protein [Caulobacterales bacterium]